MWGEWHLDLHFRWERVYPRAFPLSLPLYGNTATYMCVHCVCISRGVWVSMLFGLLLHFKTLCVCLQHVS